MARPKIDPDIEEATLRAFVRRERGDRYVALLKSKKRRESCFESSTTSTASTADSCSDLRKARIGRGRFTTFSERFGAPDSCYVISSWKHDGEELDLLEALETFHATGMGTIISCIPGRLAYYEGEDQRFILARD